MSKRPLTWLSAISVVCCLDGCSFLFVEAAPADHATRPYFTCTSSRVAPIFDTIGASIFGLNAVAQTAVRSSTDADIPIELTVFTFALAATLGASAANGYANASECSDATTALYNRQRIPMSPLAPVNGPTVAPVPTAPAPVVPTAPAAPIPPHEAPVLLFGEPTPTSPPAPATPPPTQAPPAPPQPTP